MLINTHIQRKKYWLSIKTTLKITIIEANKKDGKFKEKNEKENEPLTLGAGWSLQLLDKQEFHNN